MILLYILLSLIAIVFILAYVLVLHRALLRWLPYRWLINSIIYPVNLYRLKKNEHEDKILIYTSWIISPRWFSNYWFGKQLNKYLENYIDETEINN